MRSFLEENKVDWCLKSRSIWLICGDENTKFSKLMLEVGKM